MNEHHPNPDCSALAGEPAEFPVRVAPARAKSGVKEPFAEGTPVFVLSAAGKKHNL